MIENLEQRIRDLEELSDPIIAGNPELQTKLGEDGFQEVEEFTTKEGRRVRRLVEDLLRAFHELPEGYCELVYLTLRNRLQKLKGYNDRMNALAASRKSDPSTFSSQRGKLISQAKRSEIEDQKELFEIELVLKFLKESNRIDGIEAAIAGEKLAEVRSEYIAATEELQKAYDKNKLLTSQLRDEISQNVVYKSLSSFGRLSQAHRRQECAWLVALIVSAVVLFLDVFSVTGSPAFDWVVSVFKPESADGGSAVGQPVPATITKKIGSEDVTMPGLVSQSLKNFLRIAVLLLFFRVCLTKYNAERHLRILYDHRGGALRQLLKFENTIDDEAKSALRLEAAKMILSDPATPYGKAETTEINMNPTIKAFEKVGSP